MNSNTRRNEAPPVKSAADGGSLPPVPSLMGRVALVTGSSRGIGRAIALAMAEAGADVGVHYRKSEEGAAEVVRRIRGLGRTAVAVKADVRHADQVERLVRETVGALGRLDILVNNAGYALERPLADTTPDDWDGQMSTLPRGYFLAAQAAAPYLEGGLLTHGIDTGTGSGRARGGSAAAQGCIINIASVAGVRGDAGFVAYSAANGAILALTRALAAELGPRGVRVNSILVSWATTEDNPINPADPVHRRFLEQLSLRRATAPEEIARTAVFLASDAASAITGALLPVDCGYL